MQTGPADLSRIGGTEIPLTDVKLVKLQCTRRT
jgi:hypothetical protein